MDSPPIQREPRTNRLCRRVRRAAMMLLIVLAFVLMGAHFFLMQLDEQIRRHIEMVLAEANPHVVIEVRSARRANSKTIEVRGLIIRDPNDAESSIMIDEAQLACDTDWRRLCRECSLEVTAVKLSRPHVRARVTSEGDCSLTRLLTMPGAASKSAPPVRIDDGHVELLIEADGQWRRVVLRDVNLRVAHVPATEQRAAFFDVQGSIRGEHVDQATFHVRRFAPNGAWAAQGAVRGLNFNDRLLENLPRVLAKRMAALSDLRASSSFGFYVADTADGRPLQYRLNGELFDGRINDPGFPYAFTDLQAKYTLSNDGMEFRDLRAKSGQTEFELTFRGDGLAPGRPFALTASADKLPLDHRLAASLPPGMQKMWAHFNPSGEIGVRVTLDYDGERWSPTVHADIWRLNYLWNVFPYQVDNAQGVMHLERDRLTIDLHTTIGGQRVDLVGELQLMPEGPPLGMLKIRSHGPVAVDEKLIGALGPYQQKFARALNFAGLIHGTATFRRGPEDPQFRSHIDMHVSRGQMQYKWVPYPVNQIEGHLEIDDQGWRIIKLEGHNNSAFVTAQGYFVTDPAWNNDYELHLKIDGVDVALDNTLRHALPNESRAIWSSLAPRGVLDSMSVRVDKHVGKPKPQYHVIAKKGGGPDARGAISLQPTWLPYQWDQVSGVAEFQDGRVALHQLSGRHGPASLTLDGTGQFDQRGWRMDLRRVSLENAVINRDFASAMRPMRLRQMLLSSRLAGTGRVEGAISFAGETGRDRVTSNWDLYIDLENGSLDLGAPARAVRGGVRLVGGYDGAQFASTGSLAIDSMLLNDIHLTRVHGPLFADDRRLLLGSNAFEVRSELPKQSVLARAYQGDVRLDGEIGLHGENPFAVNLSIANGNMAHIVRQWSTTPDELRGRVHASLDLQGTGGGSHTWRGSGDFHLSHANIYRLPLMVGLLNLLAIRQPEETAFTNGDALFRLQGEHVYFDRIDFSGDIFTLRGTGEMDLQRNVNAQFYAAIGRDNWNLPMIRPLLGETSRSFLLIEVSGTLDQPDVRRTAFPEINERLQQLLPPEVAERLGERRLLPRLGDLIPRLRR